MPVLGVQLARAPDAPAYTSAAKLPATNQLIMAPPHTLAQRAADHGRAAGAGGRRRSAALGLAAPGIHRVAGERPPRGASTRVQVAAGVRGQGRLSEARDACGGAAQACRSITAAAPAARPPRLQGLPALREAIAGACFTSVQPGQVVVAAPQELVLLTMQALLRPGDRVVCTFPGYQVGGWVGGWAGA